MDQPVRAVVLGYFLCCLSLATSSNALDFPQPKIWWAKYISADIYTAGKLTERQIKYAGEAGFKSLVSMFSIDENRTLGEETIPDRDTEEYIATEFAHMHFKYVLPSGFAWKDASVTQKIAEIFDEAPKPILFHCEAAFSASFHALGYLALKTADNSDFKPVIKTEDWFSHGAQLGYDYAADPVLREIAAEITREEEIEEFPPPVVSIPGFQNAFWHMKPVYDNWYITGQIQRNHLDLIRNSDFEFPHIIITRYGEAAGGTPSQEEVTLLNIADDTGTYVAGGRQTKDRLLDTRLHSSKPNAYVSWDSEENYESRNPLEFGDEVGFNVTRMTDEIMMRLPYSPRQIYHTPFGKQGENFAKGEVRVDDCWNSHKEIWCCLEGNILVSGRDGTRPLITALLGAGTQNGFPASWALSRAAELGYDFSKTRPDVVAIFTEVLGEDHQSSGASSLVPDIINWT